MPPHVNQIYITLRIGPFHTVIHISLSTLSDDILLRRSEQITLSSNNTHSFGTRALRLSISTVQLLVCLSSNLTSSNLEGNYLTFTL